MTNLIDMLFKRADGTIDLVAARASLISNLKQSIVKTHSDKVGDNDVGRDQIELLARLKPENSTNSDYITDQELEGYLTNRAGDDELMTRAANTIEAYERQIAQLRVDLLNAQNTIKNYELSSERKPVRIPRWLKIAVPVAGLVFSLGTYLHSKGYIGNTQNKTPIFSEQSICAPLVSGKESKKNSVDLDSTYNPYDFLPANDSTEVAVVNKSPTELMTGYGLDKYGPQPF